MALTNAYITNPTSEIRFGVLLIIHSYMHIYIHWFGAEGETDFIIPTPTPLTPHTRKSEN